MGRLIPLLVLLAGCASSPKAPPQWAQIPAYSVPDPTMLVATEPVPLLASDPAPHDGWLLTEEDFQRLKDELRDAGDAYDALLLILGKDRAEADASIADLVELLKTCRANIPRAAAAACAACAAGAGGIVGGACAAR